MSIPIELWRRCRLWNTSTYSNIADASPTRVLRAEGLGRLDHGDRATAEQRRRYQRDRPGELVHVDVKKLSGIPDGGGWRIHGRGQAPSSKRSTVGYRFIHTAVDDRTRVAYSEILDEVERFHRILLEEWAYVRDWHTDDERRVAYDGFIHFYNHHRSHGSLGWASPIGTLTRCTTDNLPAEHS